MPLIKTTQRPYTKIFFWKINESLTFLKHLYAPTEKENIDLKQIKLEIKQKHFLLLRFLLSKENIPPSLLYYNQNGKPFLKKECYLSVSHSKDIFCIALSSLPIGIDVEIQTPRILKVASKFTHWEDSSLIEKEQIEALTKIWTIKEALYKAHDARGANFKHQLIINEPFSLSKKTFEGIVNLPPAPTHYQLYTSSLENFAWSLAIKKHFR